MGLFSNKKKIYVASSCYNMAGEEAQRPDYLKSVVVGAVITGNPGDSLGTAIQEAYSGGPGAKIKSYYRWARDHYSPTLGFTSSGVASAPNISPDVVAAHIPSSGDVSVQSVHVGPADFEIWAQQWMLENHYELFNDEWSADYNDSTSQIVITLGGSTLGAFVPAGFDKNSIYISATYNDVLGDSAPVVDAGPWVTLAQGQDFPSTSGYSTVSYTETPFTVPEPFTELVASYSKTYLLPADEFGSVFRETDTVDHKALAKRNQAGDLVLTADGHVIIEKSYKNTTSKSRVLGYSPLKVFIYRVGSGIPALDSQITSIPDSLNGFLPPIPVRVDNSFLSESYLPTHYQMAKKAYRRLIGSRFDKLVEKLADNPDLDDIDYVYVVPGVSLNVVENACRRYIYEFFHNLSLSAIYAEAAYSNWGSGVGGTNADWNAWYAWLNAQGTGGPLDGTEPPPMGSWTTPPSNEIRLYTGVSDLSYDTTISWQSIVETSGSGVAKTGAKKGDVWLITGAAAIQNGPIFGGSLGSIPTDAVPSDIFIYHQTGANTWKRLRIRGLVHRNYIYKGKYVEIDAASALADTEESGFIVPIHYNTLKQMSAKDSAQMTTASLFLVINCYQVVKKKWYQTGIFKIFAVVIIIVFTIVFPPAGLAGASAMTIAAVTLANILISLLLFRIVNAAAVAVFGKKVGSVLAVVITFALMNPEMLQQSMSQNLAYLAKADNLLKLTSAIGKGISDVIVAEARSAMEKTQGVLNDYEAVSKEISDLSSANLNSGFSFDALSLTDSSFGSSFVVEPSNVFLTRTLMTGSDIAELSLNMVSDFTSLTLNTELPF